MSDMPKIGEFCWNELGTPDVKKAKDFYGNVFGWTFRDVDMGNMTYTMIKNSDKEIGGIWTIPKDQIKEIPPHWMTYILVENVDEAFAKALKQGASEVKPVMTVGENYGRMAIIKDPTGAYIALWQAMRKGPP